MARLVVKAKCQRRRVNLKKVLQKNYNMLMMLCQLAARTMCFLLMQWAYTIHCVRPNDTVHFVLSEGDGCSFALPLSASVMDLHRKATNISKVSSLFEVQFRGETIANSHSDPFKTINEIPSIRSAIQDLESIWGTGYRIPIKLRRPIPSEYDWTVYASLIRMFDGSDPNMYIRSWYQFIMHCVKSWSCLVQDICDKFAKLFYCRDGVLISITLQRQRIVGLLDLSVVPQTVTRLELERNLFTKVIGLDQLSGKELSYFDIRNNPLALNLDHLISSSNASKVDNPLKVLRVNLFQISHSLIGKRVHRTDGHKQLAGFYENVSEAATRWIAQTTLDRMIIGRRVKKSWFVERRNNESISSKCPPLFRVGFV